MSKTISPAMVASPDSAIGTATSSTEHATQHRYYAGENVAPPTSSSSSATRPPQPKIVCRRNFERMVKETELFTGSPSTSRAQLLSDSKLLRDLEAKRLRERDGMLEEMRRYYVYDTARHEYRLHYAREVRLRSESNLAESKLADDAGISVGTPTKDAPFERTQSSGRLDNAGVADQHQLRRPVSAQVFASQSPVNLQPKDATTTFMRIEDLPVYAREPERRRAGAFERNSVTRKPLHHQRTGSDPLRRRQWSGGARRATELKLQQQQQLGLPRVTIMGHPPDARRPAESMQRINYAENADASAGRILRRPRLIGRTDQNDVLISNELLRDLLRPLRSNIRPMVVVKQPEYAAQPHAASGKNAAQPIKTQTNVAAQPLATTTTVALRRQSLHESEPLLVAVDGKWNLATEKSNRKDQPRSVWDLCWRRSRNSSDASDQHKKLPEEGDDTSSRALLRRLLCCVLCPLVMMVIGAIVVIVLVLYYS